MVVVSMRKSIRNKKERITLAHITINQEKCKSCYLCIAACPKHLIKKSDKAGITSNYVVEFCDISKECIGCKACAVSCPHLAITEVFK